VNVRGTGLSFAGAPCPRQHKKPPGQQAADTD
jgi:hypothetical protein